MVVYPFSIKFRKQIESGQLKVVTHNNVPVDIVCFELSGNFPILGITTNDLGEKICKYYTLEGYESYNSDSPELFLVSDKQFLTEFERVFCDILKDYRDLNFPDPETFVGDATNRLLPTTLSSLPAWRKMENGACGGNGYFPKYLVKHGNSYSLSDCLGPGDVYLVLEDLNNLPKIFRDRESTEPLKRKFKNKLIN